MLKVIKMELSILKTEKDLDRFNKNFKPRIENFIEYEILGTKSKILITAEHAQTTRIKSPEYGEDAYVGIGDMNTDELAKLAAYYSKCSYIVPTLLRTEIDLSRPPGAENLILHVIPLKADPSKKTGKKKVAISTKKNFRHIADFYHKKIEKINPRFILAYHGMHSHRKMDILLGFGPDRKYIGGSKNAFKFKKMFKERLTKRLKEANIRDDLIVKVGKSLFTGTKNYTLYNHVKKHNEKTKEKRFGMHVEFNMRGRRMKKYSVLPKLRYQVAAQVLVECAEEWLENSK